MKALSIIQPWAWVIVNGYKPVENRDWCTQFRGEFLMHARKKFDENGWHFIRENFPHIPLPQRDQFERGGIVGRATVVDCVSDHESDWFFGRFGFVIADAQPMPFMPLRGQLGFFEVDAAVLTPEGK